jgi:hypothetical protein
VTGDVYLPLICVASVSRVPSYFAKLTLFFIIKLSNGCLSAKETELDKTLEVSEMRVSGKGQCN